MVEDEENEPIEIPLGKSGLYAWVDQEDREFLKYNWHAKSAGTKKIPHYYAFRTWSMGKARGEYYLHNEVWEKMMGAALPRGFLVDHINGDKLDNRKSNLRLATRSDNEANKQKRRTHAGKATSSRYKGVSKMKNRNKCWKATITREKRQMSLGVYYTEEEAAKAYNKAALEHFGEFAVLNKFE